MIPITNLSAREAAKRFTWSAKPDTEAGQILLSITGVTPAGLCGPVNIPEAIDGNPVTEVWLTISMLWQGISVLRIPKTVEYLRFQGDFDPVTRLEIDPENPWYRVENDALILKDGNRLSRLLRDVSKYSVPEGVETICKDAFLRRSVTAVHLPDSVHTVEGRAFADCVQLETVTGGNGLVCAGPDSFEGTLWSERNPTLILGTTLLRQKISASSLVIPEGITCIAEKACSFLEKRNLLEQVSLPSTLQIIGDSAFFMNSRLKDVTLPQGLRVIGDSAFARCESLEKIVIPPSVQQMGYGAFSGCKALKKVVLEGVFSGQAKPNLWDETVSPGVLPSHLFGGCEGLKSVSIPEGFVSIGSSAFANSGLEEIILPESLDSIWEMAFEGCPHLRELRLPKQVRFLGEGALPMVPGWFFTSGSAALKRVDVDPENPWFRSEDGILFTRDGELVYMPPQRSGDCYEIPDWCVSVRKYAFQGNAVIRKLVIPESVAHIGLRAFAEMQKLEEVIFTGTREKLGMEWFLSSRNLASVTFPAGLRVIGQSCFAETGLKALTLPDTLETLETSAFSQTSLKAVTIPGSVRTIGYGVFAGVPDITVFDTIDTLGSNSPCLGYLGTPAHNRFTTNHLFAHTITVRSMETGRIKHIVRMPADQIDAVESAYKNAWRPGGAFRYETIDALFKRLTPEAKMDYALIRLGMWEELEESFRQVLSRYCARTAKELFALAVSRDDTQALTLLEPHGIVKKTTLDNRLETADQAGAVACKAWLLEWQNQHISPEAQARRAKNALKLKL